MKTAKITKYSIESFVEDFYNLTGVSPIIRDVCALNDCCVCGDPSAAITVGCTDRHTLILAHCAAHIESDMSTWKPSPTSAIGVPGNDEDRVSMILDLRNEMLKALKRERHLPVVMRLMKVDECTMGVGPSDAIAYGMAVSKCGVVSYAPMVWHPDDGLMLGGQVARDAVEISASIRAGKTEATLLRGSWLLTSNDTGLLKSGGAK